MTLLIVSIKNVIELILKMHVPICCLYLACWTTSKNNLKALLAKSLFHRL